MNELQVTQNNSLEQVQPIGAYLLERFIAYLDTSPKTVETYTRDLRQFFNFLSLNGITKPTREDIIVYRDELKASGHKPTTIQNYITAVKVFFGWTEQERIYPNIATHLKGAKLDKEHKKDYLTSGQVKEILADVDRSTEKGLRDYSMLYLMVTCGLRTIEVARADIGDLRTLGDSTVLYIQGKGREEKTEFVNITPSVEQTIRAYLKARGKTEEQDPLFTSTSHNNKGERLTTRSISGIAKERMKGAGYDSPRLTAHSLRHTAVTLSILAGKPIEEVSQFARHANLATTMIYNHALDKKKNSCSEAVTQAITA